MRYKSTHLLSPTPFFAACLCICQLVRAAAATEPPVTSIAFAPDGKSVLAGSQAGLYVYSWPQVKLQRKIQVAALNIHDLAFSPSGDRLAVGGGTPAEEGVVEIFSWPGGDPVKTLSGHEDAVMAVAWRDESSVASASLDHSITIWDTRSGRATRVLKGHSRGVSSICFLSDQQTLVSAGIDQSLRVWTHGTGVLLHSLNQHTRRVHALALRPGEGRMPVVASASRDRTVRLWQPTIGRMVRFVRLKAVPLNVAWLNDGSSIVAACADGHIRIIDPDSVEVTLDIPAVDGWAYSLAVHPADGSIVAGGRNGQVRRVIPGPANDTTDRVGRQ
jgi:WD40 repeat protein